MSFGDQLVNIFTKNLISNSYDSLGVKRGMFDLGQALEYDPIWIGPLMVYLLDPFLVAYKYICTLSF